MAGQITILPYHFTNEMNNKTQNTKTGDGAGIKKKKAFIESPLQIF